MAAHSRIRQFRKQSSIGVAASPWDESGTTAERFMKLAGQIHHRALRVLTGFREKPLAPPSAPEVELIERLRSSYRQISPSLNERHNFWADRQSEISQLVLRRDPRAFLRWETIESTMCVSDSSFVLTELRHLQAREDWNRRWKPAIQECSAGYPKRFSYYPKSSATLIHHAYHVCRFEEATGLTITDQEMLVEFGGGYGSMCRLLHNLGFKGKYVIFDLPEFCALQRFFLELVNQSANESAQDDWFQNIVHVSEVDKLKALITDRPGRAIFIGTWSLSEAPLKLRERILPMVSCLDGMLLAYQERFGEIDNVRFFSEWTKSQSETLDSVDFAIDHLPGNRYLIAKPLASLRSQS